MLSRYPIFIFEDIPGLEHRRKYLICNINFLLVSTGNDLVRSKFFYVLIVRFFHLVFIYEFVHGDARPPVTFPEHVRKSAKQNSNVVLDRLASPLLQTNPIFFLSSLQILLCFLLLFLVLFITFISRIFIVTVLGLLLFLFCLSVLACRISKLNVVKVSQN